MATFGKVIIIGRAGCCITESLPLGIHVRLTASLKNRVEKMGSVRGDSLRSVQHFDRDRAKLVRIHFRRDITDPLLYDAIYNTDRLPLDLIAQIILSIVNTKVDQTDHFQSLS